MDERFINEKLLLNIKTIENNINDGRINEKNLNENKANKKITINNRMKMFESKNNLKIKNNEKINEKMVNKEAKMNGNRIKEKTVINFYNLVKNQFIYDYCLVYTKSLMKIK